MADNALSFDDLVPAGGDTESSPSLAFDDLIPSTKSEPKPNVWKGPRGGTAQSAPMTSRDDSDLRPSSRDVDPFAEDGAGALLKRRGKQFVEGATDSVAAIPEGMEVLNRSRELQVNKSSEAVLPGLMKERDDLEAILLENRPKAKAGDFEAQARVKAAENRLYQVNGQMQMASRMKDSSAAVLARPVEDTLGYSAGAALREGEKDLLGVADPRDQGFWARFARTAGGAAGTIAATAVGGAVAGPAGALVAGGTQGATYTTKQLYEEAIQAGADEETALAASKWGAVIGASEVVPVLSALKFLPSPLKGKITSSFLKAVGDIALNSGEEAAQEALSQVAQNLVAQNLYDPKRGWADGIGESALMGAMLGGGTSAAVQILSPEKEKPNTNPKVTTGDTAPDTTEALKTAGQNPAGTPATAGNPATAPQGASSAVAPDAAAALGTKGPQAKSVEDLVAEAMKGPDPVTPAGNPQAPAPAAAPVAEEAPTPAPTPAPAKEPTQDQAVEAAGDTLPTVTESPETLEAQRTALKAGKKKAVLYPFGTPVPEEIEGSRFKRIYINKVGIFDYDSRKISASDIRSLAKFGKLNEVLELGPYNKAQVAESVASGAPEAGVVERAPDGTEVKAAAASAETAPDQLEAMEATKTAPGNTVAVESPAKVLNDRLAAAPQAPVTQAPAPSPAAQALAGLDAALESKAPPAEAPAAPVDAAKLVRENAIRTLQPQIEALGFTTEEVLAMPRGQQQSVIEKAKAARTAPEPKAEAKPKPARKPKAAAAVETSKAKEEPKPEVIPEGNVTRDDGPTITVDPKTGKRIIQLKADAETQRQIDEAEKRNDEVLDRNLKAMKGPTKTEVSEKREASAAKRKEIRASVNDRVANGRLKRGVREAVARIGLADSKNRGRDKGKVQNAVKAQNLLDELGPKRITQISTKPEREALRERLNNTLEQAANREILIPKEVNDSVADAVVWLVEVNMMAYKLNATRPPSANVINDWLIDEALLVNGDSRPARERRRVVGDEMANTRKLGGDMVENVAAPNQTSLDEIGNEESASVDVESETSSAEPVDIKDVAVDKDAAPEDKRAAKEAAALDNIGRDDRDLGARTSASSKGPARISDNTEKAKVTFVTSKGKKVEQEVERAQAASEGKVISGKTLTEEQKAAALASLALAKGKRALETDEDASDDSTGDIELLTLEEVGDSLSGAAFLEALTLDNKTLSPREAKLQRLLAPYLARALARVAGETKVYLMPDADFDTMGSSEQLGVYVKEADAIYVRRSVMEDKNALAHLMLHEGAHAAFEAAIEADTDASRVLKKQLETLLAKVKAHAAQNGLTASRYGFKDIHEFLSEAWANPQFQEYLSTVPLTMRERAELGLRGPETISVKNAMTWLRNAIANVLKLKDVFTAAGYPAGTKSTLDGVLEIAGRLLELAPEARTNLAEKLQAEADADLAAQGLVRPMTTDALPGGDTSKGNTVRQPKGRAGYARAMKDRGLNDRQALEVADLVMKKYDGKATNEQLDRIAALIKGEADRVEALVKAEKVAKAQAIRIEAALKNLGQDVDAAIDEDFVPGKNPGRPWLLKLKTTSAVARIGDRFFGEDNPLRRVASLIQRRDKIREGYRERLSEPVADMLEAAKKFKPKQVEALYSLAHDATMAGVHPDVGLDHEMNAHLGKDALKGMYAKGAHPKLKERFDALPPELQALYVQIRDTLTETQNLMTLGNMRNTLASIGFDDPAMVKRFHEGTATELDYAMVGEEVAHHLTNAEALRKVEGPYFNLERYGDHVVRGTYQLTVPGNAKKLSANEFEFKTRKEAIDYVQNMAKTEQLKSTIQSVWVDKNTGDVAAIDEDGKRIKISSNDVDAENRFRVRVQNEHVEFVDGRGEAIKLAKELEAKGLTVKDVVKRDQERNAKNSEMLSDQFRALMTTLDKRGATSKLSAEQRGELVGVLNEVSLKFLGSTRIQSSRLPRRFVQGASKDLAHSTYDYVKKASGYLAKLDTEMELQDALKESRRRLKSLETKGTGAGEGAQALVSEIEGRVTNVDYGDSQDGALRAFGNRVLRLSSLRHLLSPAYSFFNMFGGGLMNLVHLGGDFNPVTAQLQILKAMKDVNALGATARGVGTTVGAFVGRDSSSAEFVQRMISRMKNTREREMLEELDRNNLFGESAGFEIAKVFEKSNNMVGRGFDNLTGYLDNIGRAMPLAVEAVNRTTGALAAYRMMYSKTKDHQKSIKYAMDSVDKTQGNYASSNAAPIFNAPGARVLLQFKKYPQLVYTFLMENMARSLRPMNKGDRRKGIATLFYSAAAMQAFAGTVGIPGMEIAKLAATLLAMAGSDDDWEDWVKWYEEKLAELTGSDKTAEMITYGVTRGLPEDFDFDMSTRVGMQDMLTYGSPQSDDPNDLKSWLFDIGGGPALGYGVSVYDGITDFLEGDVLKGASKIVPAKQLADALKAWDGIKSEKMNASDAVQKVLGVTSGRQARASSETGQSIRDSKDRKAEEKDIISDFIESSSEAERIAIWKRAQKYNDSLEENGRKLTKDYLIRLRTKTRVERRKQK